MIRPKKLPFRGKAIAMLFVPKGATYSGTAEHDLDGEASRRDACLALRLMDSEDYLLGAQVRRGHKLKDLSVYSAGSVRGKDSVSSVPRARLAFA